MKIYIAAPYRHPDPVSNTHRAALAWHILWEAGYFPVCPHVSLVLDLVKPLEPEDWLRYDLEILAGCGLLLRLPGFSKGADDEVEFCEKNDIPVFRGTAEQFVESNFEHEDCQRCGGSGLIPKDRDNPISTSFTEGYDSCTDCLWDE